MKIVRIESWMKSLSLSRPYTIAGDDRIDIQLPQLSTARGFVDRRSDQVHVPLRMHQECIRRIEGLRVHRSDLVMEVGHRRSDSLGYRSEAALVLRMSPSRVVEAAIRMTVELNPVHRVSRPNVERRGAPL